MRGVKCSWIEMQRLHREVLPALERGDAEKYADMRCLDPKTVSNWKRASEVMSILDDEKSPYGDFENFQPTHAREIARHFRKVEKNWSEETKAKIVETVDRCEAEAWTVEQLRSYLHNEPFKTDDTSELSLALARARGIETAEQLIELEGSKYGCVYADPPWQYGNQATRASTDNHYDTMTVEQLCEMPVSSLVADDAHLHLWTTNAFLFESKRVMEAWGFEYRSVFVWVKPQMGIGNYWRVSHEFLLLGIRGNAKRFNDRSLKSWGEFERGRHSAKPDAVRAMVEKASGGPYLELFGREAVPGWTVFGNQIDMSKRLFAG